MIVKLDLYDLTKTFFRMSVVTDKTLHYFDLVLGKLETVSWNNVAALIGSNFAYSGDNKDKLVKDVHNFWEI